MLAWVSRFATRHRTFSGRVGAISVLLGQIATLWVIATGPLPFLRDVVAEIGKGLTLPDLSGWWPVASPFLTVVGIVLLLVWAVEGLIERSRGQEQPGIGRRVPVGSSEVAEADPGTAGGPGTNSTTTVPPPPIGERVALETVRSDLRTVARGRGVWRQLLSGKSRYDDAAAYVAGFRGRPEYAVLPEEIRELMRRVILASRKRGPGHRYDVELSAAVDALSLQIDDVLHLADTGLVASAQSGQRVGPGGLAGSPRRVAPEANKAAAYGNTGPRDNSDLVATVEQARHAILTTHGTDVGCACGWNGPGQDYDSHRSESVVRAIGARGAQVTPPASPKFKIELHSSNQGVFVRVLNDGPRGRFRGEVISITSEHFDPTAEDTGWPWPIRWGVLNAKPEIVQIDTANRADLHLVAFDERGAKMQLQHRGGAPFQFPEPTGKLHGIHGRLGVATIEELRAEQLRVTFTVTRLGDPEVGIEATACFGFLGTGKLCEPPA
jgi:hypothetical protein